MLNRSTGRSGLLETRQHPLDQFQAFAANRDDDRHVTVHFVKFTIRHRLNGVAGVWHERITPATIELEDLLEVAKPDGTEPLDILG
jgi:hypothetical protein